MLNSNMASKKPLHGIFYGMKVLIKSSGEEYPVTGLCLGIYRDAGSHPIIEYYRILLDDGSNHFISKDTVQYVNALPVKAKLKRVK